MLKYYQDSSGYIKLPVWQKTQWWKLLCCLWWDNLNACWKRKMLLTKSFCLISAEMLFPQAPTLVQCFSACTALKVKWWPLSFPRKKHWKFLEYQMQNINSDLIQLWLLCMQTWRETYTNTDISLSSGWDFRWILKGKPTYCSSSPWGTGFSPS